MRFLKFAVISIVVSTLAGAFPAYAKSPYDTTYSVRSDTPVRTAMKAGASVKATLPSGTKGIVLRWCRPEFPFGKWEFGNSSVKRKLLAERWCEIQSGGVIGNVEGKALRPE